MRTVLELRDIHHRFGGVKAVDGLTMAMKAGTVHGLIGPNGAGKTTAFNIICGLYVPSQGQVLLNGRDITRLASDKRAKLGLARTFQTPRLFEDMTVLENVVAGRYIHGRIGIAGAIFSIGAKAREEAAMTAKAWELLEQVGLADEAATKARNLSYGHRRQLEIGRALALEPDILLFDEIAAGINPVETGRIAAIIDGIRASGKSVLLVEHDMPFIMGLCDHITVTSFGKQIASGVPAEIQNDDRVIEAYLGRSAKKRKEDAAHA